MSGGHLVGQITESWSEVKQAAFPMGSSHTSRTATCTFEIPQMNGNLEEAARNRAAASASTDQDDSERLGEVNSYSSHFRWSHR